MTHQEYFLKIPGYEIYTQSWTIENPKAIVAMVHGLGEHSGRYSHVADMLNNNGFSAYAIDQLGHGKTPGKRGFVKSYEDIMQSLQAFIDDVKEKNPGKPVFLYGHSFGGNVVANFCIKRHPDLKGVILSAPWFTLPFEPPKLLVAFAKLMRNIYPSMPNNNQLDVTAISRDANEVQKYKDDKLNHYTITPALFFPTFENGKEAINQAKELKLPTLLMHGDADRLTSYEGSKAFAENANSNVEFKSWPGFFHEIHNEPMEARQQIFDYMLQWLNKQLSK
jgi:alpha-beta hydrolase superfamily lysophospholipase